MMTIFYIACMVRYRRTHSTFNQPNLNYGPVSDVLSETTPRMYIVHIDSGPSGIIRSTYRLRLYRMYDYDPINSKGKPFTPSV